MQTNAASAATPVVGNSSTSIAATTKPAIVRATPAVSGAATLSPSLTASAPSPAESDPFVDDSSSLLAAAPVAPPASANAPAATPAVNDFASSLPAIGGSPAAVPSVDPAMPNSSLPNADLSRVSPPTVRLTAPTFVNYRGSPLLVVQATAGGANNTLNPTVEIDIDLKHDGSFTDSGDADFATGTIGLNQTAAITLTTPLSAGTYTLAARVADAEGNVGVSANATMVVDPYSGFVGSEPLLDLAYGLPYGTIVPPGGLQQSGGGENGPTTPTPGTPKPQDFNFLEFDQQDRVLVNVHSTFTSDLAGLQSDLQTKLGFTATGTYPSQNMVTGWLPINQIVNLPNLANFDSVTPVYKPQTNIGSYPTDDDPVIHSDTFRIANNVDGTGVKVGVLSDSVNEFGGGLAQSVATGDLPANVQVLQDDLAGNGTDEGRAMLEIVHHIAPGASLAFNSGFNGAQSFAQGIQNLASAGANVITDDLTYFDEPVFNDGVIAKAAESVVNAGVFYTSSAGNDADHAYLADYKGIAATVGSITGQFQDITGTGDPLQTFTLAVGDTATIGFTWDAAYLEGGAGGTGNYVVPNDFIAQVTDANGKTLSTPQVFDAMAQNTNEASDIIQFTNDGSFGTNNFAFSFNLASGPAPTMVYWQSFDDGGPGDPMALGEGAETIIGHHAATGTVPTGAVDYTTPNTIEPFSALGGSQIPILFDSNGARLTTPEVRTLPTVAAPDGVQTSFFGQQDAQGAFRFFGTSAATPAVAAAAALLKQAQPTATPADVTQYLVTNALDINDPLHSGAGLIQLTVPFVIPRPSIPYIQDVETNQTSDTATNEGVLSTGQTFATDTEGLGPLPDGRNDYDWFSFTAGQAGTFVATEQTVLGFNVELQLFTLQGNTLVELAKSVAQGVNSQSLGVAVAAGQEVLVEVKGQNSAFGIQDEANYNLTVSLD